MLCLFLFLNPSANIFFSSGHPEPTVTFKRRAGEELVPISDDDKFEINKQTVDNQNLKAMEQWYSLKVKISH